MCRATKGPGQVSLKKKCRFEVMMMKHRTRDGQEMLIMEMTDTHLENTIRWIERKAEEGIEVIAGCGIGSGAEDICDDYETLRGREALDHFNYGHYVAERQRRRDVLTPAELRLFTKNAIEDV